MAVFLDRLYHLHWVEPGLARSAQPYLGFYRAFLKPHAFRSLINLRGRNESHDWWQKEKQVTEALGIRHFDVRLSSRNIPSRQGLGNLFAAFEIAETPVLIKCSGGQDRSSLGCALYLLWCKGGKALPEAEAQFAFWPYLHRPKKNQHWLRHFPAYAVQEAGAEPLAQWARARYEPKAFALWLKSKGVEHSDYAFQAEEVD